MSWAAILAASGVALSGTAMGQKQTVCFGDHNCENSKGVAGSFCGIGFLQTVFWGYSYNRWAVV
jgi:hypothetical protein